MKMHMIINLNGMAKNLGKKVAKDNHFSMKELKEYIKVSNIKAIIAQYCALKDDRLWINEERLMMAYEDIHQWLVGVDLAKKAAHGSLDCYWDDDKECMVFSKIKEKKDDLA